MAEHLPNFFIVGAAKSGTTSLYEYLKQHPEVYMAPIKETHHFSTDIDPASFRPNYARSLNKDLSRWLQGDMKEGIFHAFVQDWNQYVQLFRLAENQKAIGEVTNSYLYSSEAAANIRRKFPDARIIMMLRNPADRAFSHYLMDLRIGYETADFMTALKKDMARNPKGWGISNMYIEIGQYARQVKRYLDTFPADRVRIYLFDDFVKNAEAVVKDLFRFLGVNDQVAIDFGRKYNPSFIPRNRLVQLLNTQKRMRDWIKGALPRSLRRRAKTALFTDKNLPRLQPDERRFLIEIFADDIRELSRLIDRDLSAWLEVKS
ncbi:MAG: sulfotransferase [Chitinophagales bacterium]|nr:sulfotransferase [Chitinophagales bacterium]MDW8393571.1 sulfotransferase [Chitinophagales bacterium]